MARIRTIKPEFWLDEDLSEITAENHLFAAALLNHCDDEGYFKANPKLLEAQIFPLRELSGTVPVFVQTLEKIGYLRVFLGSDGKQYGHVLNFNKHQSINKAKPSKIRELEVVPDQYGTDTGQVPLGREQGTGKGTGISSSNANSENSEHIAWKYEPSEHAVKELRKMKIPDKFALECLSEFRAYRSTQPELPAYDAKFISNVQTSWKKIGHDWKPSHDPAKPKYNTRNAGVFQRFLDGDQEQAS